MSESTTALKGPLTRCDRERVVLKPMKIALAIAALGKRLV